jgi:mannose-6-phosphate isomerase-like protein (cupin superfamily)
MNLVEHVNSESHTLALIVRAQFQDAGVHFFTPGSYSQQLAYMHHPKGKVIEPHRHKPVKREITTTQEVLIIRRGRLRVDFYSETEQYLESRELGPGDVLLLVAGGHGFEVLEEIEMIEVKQGPYAGADDKARFAGKPA